MQSIFRSRLLRYSSASLVTGVVVSRYMVPLHVPFLLNGFGPVPHKLRPGPFTLDPIQYGGAVNPAVIELFHMVHQPTQCVCCSRGIDNSLGAFSTSLQAGSVELLR